MKGILWATEAGCILLKDLKTTIFSKRFEKPLEELAAITKGEAGPELVAFVKEAVTKGITIISVEPTLVTTLVSLGLPVEETESSFLEELRTNKTQLMIEAGLVSSETEVREVVRRFALVTAEEKLREMATSLDLHVIQSIQALDEIDKTINEFTSRLREWYGIHFPELASYVSDPLSYVKMTLVGERNGISSILKEMHVPEERGEKIISVSSRSKGGAIRPEDLEIIKTLGEEILRLSDLRSKLTKHVESTMLKVAPNVTSLAGATVGARLISKAGGLNRLARMPASTIQVLGAEKALFRAMKTGSRPPKHGVLFQHPEVHSAPKWERGRVARLIAGKIAIAARIDAFRGGEEPNLTGALKRRLEEIKAQPRKEPPPRKEEPRWPRREKRRC